MNELRNERIRLKWTTICTISGMANFPRVSDNVEKSVLYLLCSLCFGIILLLVAVTIKMACCRRMSPSTKLDDNDPVRLADSVSSVKWRSPESESSTGDERTFQGDEDVEAAHGAHHHHHHNHHPRQGHSWHRGANSPSAPPAAVNRESPGDISGAEGTALMKSRRVSDGEILPPQRQGTQSLPRGTAPHLWYNQDASEGESPIAESAQTLQPTRHYNRWPGIIHGWNRIVCVELAGFSFVIGFLTKTINFRSSNFCVVCTIRWGLNLLVGVRLRLNESWDPIY